MRVLDRIDKMILDILQRHGRISLSELAEAVNLSPTPCSERVKRLEREGIITGYHATINPNLVNKPLLVFIEIKLSAKSADVFDKVATTLGDIPEVLECHLISGEFDYLIKARLSEMGAYRALLGDILDRLPALASSRSSIVMEQIKESLYVGVD